ncbi:MAG TPA: molybdopterin cofactor-binding domain-containing protein [Pseudonocardia sp.]|nr:molybdopterin cofactor-binding domain-containing protein [Pseudonocardia sp.]
MGVATTFHMPVRFTADATVRLSMDGTVLVRCGLHEIGVGAATAQAQIAADALGVPVEAVTVELGDSSLPVGPMAGGSAQTATATASVLRGRLRVATGAHFCEVAVDEDTGEIRVTRWVAVFDVGRVINAKTAVSQLCGGIVMGIGAALTEETLVDPRTGRIMNAGLADYHVPVQADVPAIDVSYLDEPDPTTPLGLLGVGEVGITGVAAAVANAVHHGTASA